MVIFICSNVSLDFDSQTDIEPNFSSLLITVPVDHTESSQETLDLFLLSNVCPHTVFYYHIAFSMN